MTANRPPIVVILGHVDHGKTSLLDYLRKSNVASREIGGITQSIRSFQLTATNNSQPITFVDTPGHEAFSQMRQRGSKVADIAVLVIAADDGIKPQTKQSLEFIRSSNLPFIVAINKADLPTADPDRVKTQLMEYGVIVEDLGGNVPSVKISAKTGLGIPDLLELIGLLTELAPATADPEGGLETVVLESRLDPKKGPLAIVIVKNGSLKIGQELFQAQNIGKVRAIINSDGLSVTNAPPSTPVEVLGLSIVPEVGSIISDNPIISMPNSKQTSHELNKPDSQLNFIIKADVAGSLEAILSHLSPKVNIITSGTGDIIDNDILMARTSNSQVLGFNLKISSSIAKLAETEKVTVKSFSIIYELFQYVDELLHPKVTEQVIGKAKVLADFKINAQRIAGCHCTEGYLDKNSRVRIVRQDQVVGQGRIKSLQQGKAPLEKAKLGSEFGAVFSPFIDFRVGDDIIATTG